MYFFNFWAKEQFRPIFLFLPISGTQPILFRAPKLDKSDTLKSASQVLRVTHDPSKKGREAVSIVSVFADNGDVIMFASSAVHWKSKLLIGSVMERLVYCEIASPYEAEVIQDRWSVAWFFWKENNINFYYLNSSRHMDDMLHIFSIWACTQ